MSQRILLRAQPLERDSFSGFGEVIESGDQGQLINNGFALKHKDVASLDTQDNQGTTTLHIYTARKRSFPMPVDMMECHPHFSQAFIPRLLIPFIVVVAPKGEVVEAQSIRAFRTDGRQGVNFFRGTWHYPLISLEEGAEFIVIDRKEQDRDLVQCVEQPLEQGVFLEQPAC